jgi:lipoate-protein ligase A
LEEIPEMMEIYKELADWNFRFGSTPDFENSLEKKFDWALIDLNFKVEEGIIKEGRCYSDCLVP